MWDFFTFRRNLTPIIIQILCWVGILGSIALGFFIILGFAGGGEEMVERLKVEDPAARDQLKNFLVGGGVLLGCGTMVIGPILVRLFCEQLILFHRINETLTDLKHIQEELVGLVEQGRGPVAPPRAPRA